MLLWERGKKDMVKEERAKGKAGIEGEGDMWNHFPYPCLPFRNGPPQKALSNEKI